MSKSTKATKVANSVNDKDSSSSSSSSVNLLKRIQKRYPGRKVTLTAGVVFLENDKCTISFHLKEDGKLEYYVYHHDHEEIDEAVKTDLARADIWDGYGSSYPG
jgi:hypothetical protein